MISGSCSTRMPETMILAPRKAKHAKSPTRSKAVCRSTFASTKSTFLHLSWGKSANAPRKISIRSFSPFCATDSLAQSTATESISTPMADAAPSFTAAMARIALPVPTSRTTSPPSIFACSHSSIMRVVAWWPVPNACLGSNMISISPASSVTGSQLGRITKRPM